MNKSYVTVLILIMMCVSYRVETLAKFLGPARCCQQEWQYLNKNGMYKSWRFLVARLLYNLLCQSVRPQIYQLLLKIDSWIFLWIFRISISDQYIIYLVRRSVSCAKSFLMFLVFTSIIFYCASPFGRCHPCLELNVKHMTIEKTY